MEPVPALFAGTVFGCFGAALLLWTAARLRQRRPVTVGGGPHTAVVSAVCAVAALGVGIWCLTQV
ncbi:MULTISPECIES: hypothetical protein [unclassified Streptomyces]|uniref:hypothetical protein n=1 Tax=unclassified Streptomyces TaxID=2593676 RepID=UPI002E2879AE|nr:hypothetical protein [Streptomyces sp. NBC_00223]